MDVRWLLKFVIAVGLHLHVCVCAENASSLYDRLFANYQPSVIPKCNSSVAVQVKIGLALRQIIDLNEPRQILESNAWVRLIWQDCQLTWNATETGIDNLVVPNNAVWIPDITLYDNAQNALGGLADYRPSIYPDGSVYYNFPSVIKSLCRVDVTYFPFDTQICKLQFGSWSYHGLDLNVTKRNLAGDTSVYISNGEWTILDTDEHNAALGCPPSIKKDLVFTVDRGVKVGDEQETTKTASSDDTVSTKKAVALTIELEEAPKKVSPDSPAQTKKSVTFTVDVGEEKSETKTHKQLADRSKKKEEPTSEIVYTNDEESLMDAILAEMGDVKSDDAKAVDTKKNYTLDERSLMADIMREDRLKEIKEKARQKEVKVYDAKMKRKAMERSKEAKVESKTAGCAPGVDVQRKKVRDLAAQDRRKAAERRRREELE